VRSGLPSNNNNNNNNYDNVYGAVIMTAIARVHPVHLMNADWATGGRQPSDQTNQFGLSPPISCYHPQAPSPFIIMYVCMYVCPKIYIRRALSENVSRANSVFL